MTDRPPVLDELERRLLAGCYPTPPARRVRTPPWPWAALGGALASAAIAVAVLVGSGSVTPPAASALAQAAAAVTREPAQAPLYAGQYWYTRTVRTIRAPLPIMPRTLPAGRAPSSPPLVTFISRESVETWIGADGTLRQRTIPLSQRFASAADRARWLASKQPIPKPPATDSISSGDGWFPPQLSDGGPDAGDGLFSYQQLLALPTNPRALLQRVEHAQAALDARQSVAFAQLVQNLPGQNGSVSTMHLVPLRGGLSAAQLTAISELQSLAELLTTPVPTAVRAALFRAAATLPGVTYDGRVADPLGRSGVAVSVGRGAGQVRLIFNPKTGVLLDNIQGPVATSTIITQAVVDSISSLPAGLSPVPGPADLAPLTIAIFPRVGTPTTTFTLSLSARVLKARPGAPGRAALVLSGPAGPRCRAALPRPLSPRAAHTTTASSRRTVSSYTLTPQATGARTWCSGRYQLQVNQAATGNAYGTAGSVYFQVR
jgi:hypothetical protein